MKQTIRNNVFETNSSSVHSLTIREVNKEYVDKIPLLDGVAISVSTFGWEFETYSNPIDLLTYLYTYACEFGKNSLFTKKLKELLPNVNFIEPYYDEYEDEEYSYLDIDCGYIDHWSDYDNLAFVFESLENLSSYLFTGVVQTGNDNSEDRFERIEGEKHFYKGN